MVDVIIVLVAKATYGFDHPLPVMTHEQRNIRQNAISHFPDVGDGSLGSDFAQGEVIVVALALRLRIKVELHRCTPLHR